MMLRNRTPKPTARRQPLASIPRWDELPQEALDLQTLEKAVEQW
jgi:hypothetical protein